MLKAFGARIDVAIGEDGERLISLAGETALEPVHVKVPADPSSAAFLIVAALLVPGSEVRIERVGVNPMRTGLFEMLTAMGADLSFENAREISSEPVAAIVLGPAPLPGVDAPPPHAPPLNPHFPPFSFPPPSPPE